MRSSVTSTCVATSMVRRSTTSNHGDRTTQRWSSPRCRGASHSRSARAMTRRPRRRDPRARRPRPRAPRSCVAAISPMLASMSGCSPASGSTTNRTPFMPHLRVALAQRDELEAAGCHVAAAVRGVVPVLVEPRGLPRHQAERGGTHVVVVHERGQDLDESADRVVLLHVREAHLEVAAARADRREQRRQVPPRPCRRTARLPRRRTAYAATGSSPTSSRPSNAVRAGSTASQVASRDARAGAPRERCGEERPGEVEQPPLLEPGTPGPPVEADLGRGGAPHHHAGRRGRCCRSGAAWRRSAVTAAGAAPRPRAVGRPGRPRAGSRRPRSRRAGPRGRPSSAGPAPTARRRRDRLSSTCPPGSNPTYGA